MIFVATSPCSERSQCGAYEVRWSQGIGFGWYRMTVQYLSEEIYLGHMADFDSLRERAYSRCRAHEQTRVEA